MFFGNVYQNMFFKHNMFFLQKKTWQKKRKFFLFLFFFWFLWLENGKSLSAVSKYSIKVSICAGKSSRCNLFITNCLDQDSAFKNRSANNAKDIIVLVAANKEFLVL